MPLVLENNPYMFYGNLVRIIDGDTIVVDIDLGFDIWKKDEHVRLAGIDTPEIRTKDLVEKAAGFKAKEFVEQKFAQYGPRMLLVTLKDSGKFGRYVAYVLLDEEGFGNFSYNLNQGLLDEGLAAIY